jgi:two-component system chemotaxis sensor kinase CheA
VPPVPAEKGVLRVSAEKIDHLLDEVGEFMQHRRQLIHSLGDQERLGQEAADVLGAGDRLFAELKDTVVGMRTLPVAVIAGPLPRAVRDLAHEQGKEAEFVVHGGDTELDRVILESLTEPLTHLLRNAVNHGIETPAERERVHKPPRGRIELRAVPHGSVVEIVVADDGRGVPPEVIGRAQHEGSLTDMLTRPGFSTAAQVSDIAGRGVGLDAVNVYVQSLGGSIEVSSEPGRGTEVALLLPLALALLEVLLFERGGAVYGVPLAAVEKVVMVSRTLTLEGRAALEMGGRALPVADFAELVGAEAPPAPDRSPALVITAGGWRVVAACDALVGQEEVVVKPLGPLLADVAGYLGTAILGDGRIALLVEPARLTRGSRPAADGEARPAAAPEPPRILVVEDSFTVRELQRSILEAAGYPVATARDGRDALRVLGGDPGIGLVITDIEMPELDGIGLTRAIRADPERRSLPVVVVTSRGSDEDRRKGAEAGADAYLVKQDFDQHALLATVERLVGR